MNTKKIVFVLFIFFQSACAAIPSVSNKDIIAQRVTARWQALINNAWDDAYQFETPGYKSSHTQQQFQSSFGRAVTWKSAELINIHLDESKTTATINLNISFDAQIPIFGLQRSVSNLKETWILDNEKWWHYSTK